MKGNGIAALLRRPVVLAPMGGGPSAPALVAAASQAGALGFLAGSYKSAQGLRADIAELRAMSAEAFGVNLFVPGSPTSDPGAVESYLASLSGDAEALSEGTGSPSWDDDNFDEKLDVVLQERPPVVSFTFGRPASEVMEALAENGTLVGVTVTSVTEAREVQGSAADFLCVQGAEAGAHRGSFNNDSTGATPLLELIAQIRRTTDLPLIAAGGITGPAMVQAVIAAGATAAQCGTAFLRCPESGATQVHKDALADPRFTTTAMTRAFSGRPARGLFNRFMQEHPDAPAAYPEINNATRPLRARAAAIADTERMSLWAGTGFRAARELPAAEVVELLCAGVRGGTDR
ncbi:MAG: NAD(P)H-dependent flavin oxidoreductase [Acidimicrobiales bacterium]